MFHSCWTFFKKKYTTIISAQTEFLQILDIKFRFLLSKTQPCCFSVHFRRMIGVVFPLDKSDAQTSIPSLQGSCVQVVFRGDGGNDGCRTEVGQPLSSILSHFKMNQKHRIEKRILMILYTLYINVFW